MKKYILMAMLSILVPLKVNAALDIGYVKDYQTCLDFQASYGQANFNHIVMKGVCGIFIVQDNFPFKILHEFF